MSFNQLYLKLSSKMALAVYNTNFPQLEESVLQFWVEHHAKEVSYDMGRDGPPFNLEDGPPFGTGLPHVGHIMIGSAKDTIIKFYTMMGYNAKRDVGFDCHGVPIELIVEKKLGITKKDIVKIGDKVYNDECRKNILNCVNEWEKVMNRIPRWVDYDKKYLTCDLKYMETEWYIFQQLFRKNLVYYGNKVMPFSIGLATPLSNFEAGLNYKEVKEKFVYVSFPLEKQDFELLVWTTTPWTLPANLAICVNPDILYAVVKDEKGKKYLVACNLVEKLFPKGKATQYMTGSILENLKYKPLFNYVSDEKYFSIVCDKYVTDASGTGIVHLAPAFGEDDHRVCLEKGIIEETNIFCPVDDHGNFTLKDFEGQYIKTAESAIINHLKETGRLFKTEVGTHSYPYCWRSDTPLIYKIVPAWFIDVPAIKDRLIAVNQQINWQPEHLKNGKFGEWLKNAKPWCVSRSRIWGTPLPIWVSEKDVMVIGSVQELYEASGVLVTDLHSDHIKFIEFEIDGKHYKWCHSVFDCWFDSGCEPYARVHYPFENSERFFETFPADLVIEGIDQTRGWFYVLLVISTALYDMPAFKNVITTGIILAEDGQKMSKSKNNYTDPMELIKQHGADALRLYLLSSPVLKGEEFKFSDAGVKLVVQNVLLQWYNAFKFFVEYYTKYRVSSYELTFGVKSDNIMDKWIIHKYNQFYRNIMNNMKKFKLDVYDHIYKFIDYLTNYYIKLNREALKGKKFLVEQHKSLLTLYTVLYHTAYLMAPFTPFMSEAMYQQLRILQPGAEESIHYNMFLTEIPEEDDTSLKTECMMKVIRMIREVRGLNNINVRTPLKSVTVCGSETFTDFVKELESYITDDCNVLEMKYGLVNEHVEYILTPNLNFLGKKFRKETNNVIKLLNTLDKESVTKFMTEHKLETKYGLLTDEDIIVKCQAKETKYKYLIDGDILILCDITKDEMVMDLYYAKMFAVSIQRTRKLVDLKPWHKIIVYYETESIWLHELLMKMSKEIDKIIAVPLKVREEEIDKAITTKELEINNAKVSITLVYA